MSDADRPQGQGFGPRLHAMSQDVARYGEILAAPALAARASEVEAGTVFYEPSEAALNLFYIRSGQVRVYQPRRQTSARLLEILGPGDWFGVQALSASSSAATYGTR